MTVNTKLKFFPEPDNWFELANFETFKRRFEICHLTCLLDDTFLSNFQYLLKALFLPVMFLCFGSENHVVLSYFQLS